MKKIMLNHLIIYLSITSQLINKDKKNDRKFIYDHLKKIIDRKIILLDPIIRAIDPEIFVTTYVLSHPIRRDRSIEFFLIDLPINIMVRNQLEKVKTVGGGSCLLNSILLALSPFFKTLKDLDKEEIGNAYRLMLSTNMNIEFDDEDRLLLRNNDEPIIENPPEIAKDSNKWILANLELIIGQKLLKKLKYNLIIIENDPSHGGLNGIRASEYNNKENQYFIILYGEGTHYELVKKKNTNVTIYTRNDLKDIFSDEVLNTDPILFGGKNIKYKLTLV